MELPRPCCPPTLPNLPTEILSLVLGNFCFHCREPPGIPCIYFQGDHLEFDRPSYALDRQALYSTCLVSRRLCDVAQGILYHDIIPGYGNSCEATQFYNLSLRFAHRLTDLLRTVTLRRDLAASVHRLCLTHPLFDQIGRDEPRSALAEAALARSVNLFDFFDAFSAPSTRSMRRLPNELASMLFASLPTTASRHHRRLSDELAAMLLASLPNLVSLSLPYCLPLKTIPTVALSVAGASSLPLQSIEVTGSPNLGQRLGGILELSSSTLQTFRLHHADGTVLKSLRCPLPSLRNVYITHSLISGQDLKSFLSCCLGLERFHFEAAHSRPDNLPLPSEIIKQLSRDNGTITSLFLDILDVQPFDGRFVFEPLPSLQAFSSLANLFLNSAFIYNHVRKQPDDDEILINILPSSLVSLRLADNVGFRMHARLAKGLLRLADAISQGQFASLRKVTCDTDEPFDEYDVGKQFASLGVEFGYDSWPLSENTPRRRGRLYYTSSSESEGE